MLSSLNLARHRLVVVGVVVAALVALPVSVSMLGAEPRQSSVRHSQPAGLPRPAGALSVQARLPLAIVRVPAPGVPISVPRSFLGISTEYWTIPVWANHLSLLGQVLSTISPHGSMVLRIGGSSADQAFWAPTKEPPEWVFEIRRSWLSQVRRIVNRFGVRVILDLNLVTATPQIAVRWARAAEAALPSESIVGFEIGNESDIPSGLVAEAHRRRRGLQISASADDRGRLRQLLPHLRQGPSSRGSWRPALGSGTGSLGCS